MKWKLNSFSMSCIFFTDLKVLNKCKLSILSMLKKNVFFFICLNHYLLVSGPTLGCYYSSMGLNRELNDQLEEAYEFHKRALN